MAGAVLVAIGIGMRLWFVRWLADEERHAGAQRVLAVALAAAGGVTLNVRVAFGASLAGQFAVATLLKRATNLWIACGDMAAV